MKIQAVIFDWAGTMIDFGSFAPMGVFVKAYKEFGIEVSIEEAREPMGAPKWDHIRSMMDMPNIASQWQAKYGALPTDDDVTKVYDVFVPMNEAVIAEYAILVPGAKSMLDNLAARNIKVGSTTGYTRSIMQHVFPIAAEQGYSPLNCVCADDLPEGRPGPLGMYQSFIDLVVHPPQTVIKVDDTPPGIKEGVAAGCITVGVALSGNHVGKTPDELAALSEMEISDYRASATKMLTAAGADYVIDSVADLPALIDRLTN